MKHDLIKRALDLTKVRLNATSETDTRYAPLKSVEAQLEYLHKLAIGERDDLSLLPTICVGLIAVRELEPDDMELANLLYEVQAEVSV
jgi:hypothetical protein